jgi:2-polyprenyl-6-methoxyphenol hydroxylase-like FAD-dependent oxidoreductase
MVLIIGGGIGGLCLAQGLTKHGLGVAVYERDGSPGFRGQGYRISLKEAGVRALRACLPGHLFDLCMATAIRPATRMAFLDERLNPKFVKPIPPVGPEPGFGVNRLTLREILLAGLAGAVHFGQTFERYEPAGDGRVRAHFAGGTSVPADLLVGADGTNSAVRAQLLPDAVIDDLHRVIYGRTPIGPGTLDGVPDVLVDTFNQATGPDGVAFSVATCRTREPVGPAAARLAPGVHLTDVPDYLSWTVSPLDDRLRGTGGGFDAPALHRLAMATVQGWHPAVARIVAEADVSATFPVAVTSARPVMPWPDGNVTLLGDAVHTMSPGRGEGANVALRDADLLRAALVDVAVHGVPLADAKARYEAEMLRYGFQAVADSLHRPFAPPARRR